MIFKTFTDVSDKYDQRIGELTAALDKTLNDLQDLQEAREKVLRDVMTEGDVSAIEGQIESTQRTIQQLTERIRYAEEYKHGQLSEMLQDLEQRRQKAVTKKEAEYQEEINELNRLKIEFLTVAARIGKLANDINAINKQANECRIEAGKEPYKYWPFLNSMTLNASPAVKGFDAAAWETLAVPEWLVKAALLENRLPGWAEEVVSNE